MTLARNARLSVLVLALAIATIRTGLSATTELPWSAAGLTERQAAAHLLDRFAYGPRPGDIDRVVAKGLEVWLEEQLQGTVDDSQFLDQIAVLDTWSMSSEEILRTFPLPPLVHREAQEAGVLSADGPPQEGQTAAQNRKLLEFYQEHGYRRQQELVGQLMAHKLLQAVYSQRQLESVLTDFWFNHFNVSMTDNQARAHLLSYERDAIGPGVVGKFRRAPGRDGRPSGHAVVSRQCPVDLERRGEDDG